MTHTTHAATLDTQTSYRMGQDARKSGLPQYPGDNAAYMQERNRNDAPATWMAAWDRAYRDGWQDAK